MPCNMWSDENLHLVGRRDLLRMFHALSVNINIPPLNGNVFRQSAARTIQVLILTLFRLKRVLYLDNLYHLFLLACKSLQCVTASVTTGLCIHLRRCKRG